MDFTVRLCASIFEVKSFTKSWLTTGLPLRGLESKRLARDGKSHDGSVFGTKQIGGICLEVESIGT